MAQNPKENGVLAAFRHAADTLPFYKKILEERNIDASKIQTEEDFLSVPIIRKEDVFPAFPVKDLCQNGSLDGFVSAIVSSGTSGVFSYGLLTHEEVKAQKQMLDGLLSMAFDVEKYPPLIINALAMGVSFASSFPVIPTSVRSDIVLHVVDTFKGEGRQMLLIGDPHFIKKVLEEGVEKGFDWKDIRISCAVGGTASSDSILQYLLSLLNSRSAADPMGGMDDGNRIFGTMGLTEIGLNVFSAMPDLIALRHVLQSNPPLMEQVFGMPLSVCPELMYYDPRRIYTEICDADARGVGDIVMSHLDASLKTMLIRYNTEDKGMRFDRDAAERALGMKLLLPLPVMAIFGRAADVKDGALSAAIVKEMLYRDYPFASKVTGHFVISGTEVRIQLKPGAKGSSAAAPSIPGASASLVPYRDFEKDVELTYETKWKHSS